MLKQQTYLLSAASGILLSLPWMFPGQSWSLFFAFVPLMLAEHRLFGQQDKQLRAFFCPALVTFLIWNVISTWWIAYVSLAGMLLVIVLNALLMAVVWTSREFVRRQLGTASSWLALFAFWLTFEFLHHRWAIPWPWLTLGNGFASSVKLIQWYEFTGVLGGSLWILLSNFFVFIVIRDLRSQASLKLLQSAGLAVGVIVFPISLSQYLYFSYSEKGMPLNVVVLQPNIDPYTEKFSGMSTEEQVGRLVLLARSKVDDSTDLILAPETALPPMWEDSLMMQNKSLLLFSEIIKNHPKVRFVAGAITKRKSGAGEVISETARRSADGSFYDVFNSALMIDRTSDVQISHKTILVNGVERMPFQKYLGFLGEFVLHLGGTSGSLAAATEPVLFKGEGATKIGPIICFESVFGEYSGTLVKKGADLLVVLTNDGWWKLSPGTWQHFSYSRLRAVEIRRCIVRCANTGVSGVINQRGDVQMQSGTGTSEALSASVLMDDQITFYTIYGDFLGRISAFLSGLIVLYWLGRRWNKW
ncbi:MAG: apolipoprotein N-acyltransferase [Prolixibacteraceae bacterium]|nr:apolipoprotein N-acyltransferase [Prolixibacteraceae bacterium]